MGEDRLPGTEDDYYKTDVDGDGEDDDIFAGADKTPGTEDDSYQKDMDGDGVPETIYVGEDTIPGTEDDYFERDTDGDGIPERIRPILITFNAHGGTVEGSHIKIIAKALIQALPEASREGYIFQGWYTKASGGTKIKSVSDIASIQTNTMLYAHWTKQGGSTGGTGGGGGVVAPTKPGTSSPDPTPGQEPSTEPAPTVGPTKDHIAYIIGDDKGMVNPMKNITRAETATIFYRLLDTDSRTKYETRECSFKDVPETAWYRTEVSTLANAGILNGRGNNLFAPNAPITRAEFATIAARFSGITSYSGANRFPDISRSWAREYINIAARLGYVRGYEDGTFRPASNITRAEAITLINRVLGRDKLIKDSLLEGMKEWPDNEDTSKWYYLAIQEATNGHTSAVDKNGTEIWAKLN